MITTLTGLAARRDRLVIPIWVYALAASAIGTVYSFRQLYPTLADRRSFARGIDDNASILAFYGRLYEPSTVGGLVAWRLVALGSALTAVMSVLLVVRHSRADEEQQRLELLRSTVVSRQAPLVAALLVTAQANLAVAVVAAAGMLAFGLPLAGSVAFGLAWLSAGLCFAAVAALTAQLAETSRTASGLALATIAAAYLLRAVGDAGGSAWLSWVSPIGWAERTRPFADEHWVVFALPAAFAVIVGAAAFAVNARRDLGAGAVAARPGPAAAGPSLRGAFGLAWRLQRGTVVAWAAALAVLGAVSGSAASSVDDLVGTGGRTRTLLARLGGNGALVDAFLVTVVGVIGLLVSAYAILVVLRMRDEESSGRAEMLLSGPLGRARWAASHLVLALAGTAALLAVAGLALGIVHGQVPALLGAALSQLPAVWLVTGLTFLSYGLAPRSAGAGWGVLGVCVLLQELGPVIRLPRWALDLSPFAHLPQLPGSGVSALPITVLSGLAVALLAVGSFALRRRDLG